MEVTPYTHKRTHTHSRLGRTGRMGRDGTVVTLAAATEEFVIQRLANGLGIAIEEGPE